MIFAGACRSMALRPSSISKLIVIGFGLAIAREYVLSYGGSLELLDKETPGAWFQLRLPCQASLETS